MNKKIKIAISSYKLYANKAVPVLLKSLVDSGVSLNDVLVVEGGYTTNERSNYLYSNNILCDRFCVNHNSFDYTALIAICEYNIESDYWLLLHDTCRVGLNFKHKLESIDLNYSKIALLDHPSMSIGLYKYDYLLKHKDIILDKKNSNLTESGVREGKYKALYGEDALLWKLHDEPCGKFGSERHSQPVDDFWYPTATNRIQEYFPQLDLYKLKANWGSPNLVTVL